MAYESYRVSVEVLENGYKVEIPDMKARAEKKAAAKKAKQLEPYYGDCTKSYAAKSVKEVMKLVQQALEQMPEGEFDAAFDEASKKR